MYGRTGEGLGAAFLAKKSDSGKKPGMFGVGVRSTGEAQKFSYPNNQCPRGYRQVGSGSDKPPSGYSKPWGDYVLCVPEPRQAAPAPQQQQAPSTNITVSPAIQTQVSPQISPVFSQMQDSPGSTQAATTAQVSPSPQSAETGGSGGGGNGSAALLEFMKMQAERDAQRQQAEDARRREQERRQQELIARQQEAQRQAQQQAQQRAEQARQEQLQREAEERQRREQQAAEMQAAYEEKVAAAAAQKQAPSTFTSTVQPGASYLPASEPDPEPETMPAEPQATLNWPLIAAMVATGGIVIYYFAFRKGA